ncbi:MAG: hydrogenase formation protein HypD [Planctomycetes bacterium]|nr:hydrogenase formation protein HypD [Planctomycetota bacterium]
MKYVDEFRDPAAVRAVADEVRRVATRPWTIMEVCGGQTHTIARYALEDLLPPGVTLIHGPGCPVCVTPLEVIAAARRIALQPLVTFCSFGDMLRVPGPDGDLLAARALGADVRVALSPLDAVEIARADPGRQVVFYAVGFETTAPATAMAAWLARKTGLANFSLLAAHVRVPPALEMLLAAPGCRVDAFLAAGHVCTVAGTGEYPAIAARHHTPIVVTGFEPLDILWGLLGAVRQLEEGRAVVENRYRRSVREDGNAAARAIMDEVYEIADRPWRGLGVVPGGGLRLRAAYSAFDAERRFAIPRDPVPEPADCRAGQVLTGLLRPADCPAFGRACTPDTPLGAPMVSAEGACAASHRYRRA